MGDRRVPGLPRFFNVQKGGPPRISEIKTNIYSVAFGPCGFQIAAQALIKMTNETAAYCAIFEDGVLKTLDWHKLKTEVHTVANIHPIFLKMYHFMFHFMSSLVT